MSNAKTAQLSNEELAARINNEALANPQSPYAGKFVGIVGGQIAVVADNLDELGRQLDALSAAPTETFCIQAGRDGNRVEEIWELR